jgi:glycogen debranching enzyme
MTGTMRYQVELEPRACWELTTDIVPNPDERRKVARPVSPGRFGQERARVHDSLTAWQLRVPQLVASWDALERAFAQSVSDLASLRMRGGNHGITRLPAAGMPWFMTVFGRDTLITSYQTLLFGPELARGALEVLAELQAHDDDPSIDAEPGKIVHEVRHGKAAKVWFPRYYGTVDATPLYLVLLSEVWRWTGTRRCSTQLREPALRALEWIDGTATSTATASSSTGDGPSAGSRTSRGRTPATRSASRRRLARRRSPLRGAGLRLRREAADGRARPRGWATRARRAARREAAELQQRFDDAFWVDERGGYYALALDADKQRSTRSAPTSATCSGAGSSRRRAEQVVAALTGESLWSGWGSGRCPPTTPATARSRTTTAPSGRTTTP